MLTEQDGEEQFKFNEFKFFTKITQQVVYYIILVSRKL